MNEVNRQPLIGEIYFMRFEGSGSEQSGWRPGLVFQNNVGNKYSPNIIALPLTSRLKKQGQPTHVVLRAEETGLPRDSMVLCENPQRMSKENLGEDITTLSADVMADIACANILATSAIAFVDPDVLLSLWERASALNAASAA